MAVASVYLLYHISFMLAKYCAGYVAYLAAGSEKTLWRVCFWKKMSVWEYFTVLEKNQQYAVCKTCSTDISGGGTLTNFNTSILGNYFKSRHEDVYNNYRKTDK